MNFKVKAKQFICFFVLKKLHLYKSYKMEAATLPIQSDYEIERGKSKH